MIRPTFLIVLLSMLASLLVVAPATAQNASNEERKAELQERFKQRYPTLARLQNQGLVGETHMGLADVVRDEQANQRVDPSDNKSQTISEFVAEENKDRDELYALLAVELRTTADKVAQRDALRRFSRAAPHHWLFLEKQGWVQKRDINKNRDQ